MKRFICVLAALVIAVSAFTACGSEVTISAKAVSFVKQAIEITDAYLDGEATYAEVKGKLSDLEDSMSYVDDLEFTDDYFDDYFVRVELSLLAYEVMADSHNGNIDTYNGIIEQRNALAERAGLKKRK